MNPDKGPEAVPGVLPVDRLEADFLFGKSLRSRADFSAKD